MTVLEKLRGWLNNHPLGAPYRGLRDLLRVSQNRRALLSKLDQQQAALQHLESLIEQQQVELNALKPLYVSPDLAFSYKVASPPYVANAEHALKQSLKTLPHAQREHWFYSFYSEMNGSVAYILERQYAAYLPHLPKIPNARVLDIGCGAGEFLAFLKTHGLEAVGIDLDAHEVVRAQEKGLVAVCAEATEYLAKTDEKFAAICLFQVIEHVPPAQVKSLVEVCARALAPGGALLIETINMRNPNTVNCFYTDPTHQVPLADNYMSFLFQWNLLENVQLIYTLPDWIPGMSSQDLPRCYANYTVLGYKPADTPALQSDVNH